MLAVGDMVPDRRPARAGLVGGGLTGIMSRLSGSLGVGIGAGGFSRFLSAADENYCKRLQNLSAVEKLWRIQSTPGTQVFS